MIENIVPADAQAWIEAHTEQLERIQGWSSEPGDRAFREISIEYSRRFNRLLLIDLYILFNK
jgi:hypothetical protein